MTKVNGIVLVHKAFIRLFATFNDYKSVSNVTVLLFCAKNAVELTPSRRFRNRFFALSDALPVRVPATVLGLLASDRLNSQVLLGNANFKLNPLSSGVNLLSVKPTKNANE